MSTDAGESPVEQRVERLERGQSSLNEKLDLVLAKLTGGGPAVSHEQAEKDTERHLDRPSSVEEQVRAELVRAEREQASKKADEDAKASHETLAQRLAKLEEVQPEPPQPRRQRVMWGAR